MTTARKIPARLRRRLLFLFVVTVVFGVVMVYPPLRLLHWLLPDWHAPVYLAPALFILPFALRLLQERWHTTWSRFTSSLGMFWLGLCFVTLCLLLPAELLVLLGVLQDQVAGQLLLAGTILLSTYGLYNAQTRHVRTVELNGPEALRGQRIAQISDVHIGSRQPRLLRAIVREVNALTPDYVVITGDLVDMHGITLDDLAPLAELNAPTLFCIGNHERYVDVDDICARLRKHQIDVLRNQTLNVRAGSGTIQFIGIDDAERRTQVREQLQHLTPEPDAYRILLYHRPDGAEDAQRWGAHLMLTGHTHRGQIVPFNLLVKKVFPQYYRSYFVGNLHLYVSPGTGTWGPTMRLGSKCEITLFRLL
ncbi:MAG: metallophosphoesterase [Pseudomonadota bacterium]